jgi:dolichol-phosphate mannosyltransferase
MVDPERILTIIPCYNERETLPSVLESILSHPLPLDVLIVDDHSPDGTAEVVRGHAEFGKRLHLFERPGKLGLGTAYLEGFQWGLAQGYDILVQMDGDGSHDARDLPKLIHTIQQGADMAVGSRYLHGVRVLNWSLDRLILSVLAGVYVRALLGLTITDPTSGFKAMHRRYLERMNFSWFKAQGYGLQIELVYTAWRGGFRVEELPIIFTERVEGRSKMSFRIALEAALRVPWIRLAAITTHQPWLRPSSPASR